MNYENSLFSWLMDTLNHTHARGFVLSHVQAHLEGKQGFKALHLIKQWNKDLGGWATPGDTQWYHVLTAYVLANMNVGFTDKEGIVQSLQNAALAVTVDGPGIIEIIDVLTNNHADPFVSYEIITNLSNLALQNGNPEAAALILEHLCMVIEKPGVQEQTGSTKEGLLISIADMYAMAGLGDVADMYNKMAAGLPHSVEN